MKIDILIAVAQKGGVENVINMVVPHFRNQKKWDVRVVQLIWEGYTWTNKETPFFPLLMGRDGHHLEEFVEVYAKFLNDNGIPDIVLATAWPYMCYVGKKALAMLGQSNINVISWLHNPVEQYEKGGYGGYSYLALADAHIAISKEFYDDLYHYFPNKPIICVHNPVDFDKCAISKTNIAGSEKKCRKLYYIGRIAAAKRLDVIIIALSITDTIWELWVIGDADDAEINLKKSLEVLARQYRVDGRIHWMGWKDNPWAYVQEADILVLSSVYEGSPLVVIEALSNGIPVISTPVSGIPQLISPGINGYIFPKEDWKFLSNILNMMAKEELPAILPENCKRSAAPYKKETAIADFACKVEALAFHHNELLLTKAGNQFTYYDDKISVIIPCYNSSAYLEECIDSLLASTLPLNMLEFIFVDDASTDNTCEIIQKYEEQYPNNILLIKCEENRKQGAARNLGMSYAAGNYIAFVDSDDKIHPELFQKLYEKIALYNCDMVGCGYAAFNEEGIRVKRSSENRLYLLTEQNERKKYILTHGYKTVIWNNMYRRQFLEEHNIKFPENIFVEDLYFYELCMMTAKSTFEISDILYYYRKHSLSTTDSVNQHNFMNIFTVQENTYLTMLERNLVEGFEQELAFLYYEKAFVETVAYMKNGINGIIWDDKAFQSIKETILSHFPDILQNPYILSDGSDYNNEFLTLLKN